MSGALVAFGPKRTLSRNFLQSFAVARLPHALGFAPQWLTS
jgi:hypothetical protein